MKRFSVNAIDDWGYGWVVTTTDDGEEAFWVANEAMEVNPGHHVGIWDHVKDRPIYRLEEVGK